MARTGMLALGAQRLETDSTAKRHMEQARDLTKTCHMMYSTTPTGLAPEIVRFPNNEGPVVDAGSKHSLLRPEAVEAFFIMCVAFFQGCVAARCHSMDGGDVCR